MGDHRARPQRHHPAASPRLLGNRQSRAPRKTGCLFSFPEGTLPARSGRRHSAGDGGARRDGGRMERLPLGGAEAVPSRREAERPQRSAGRAAERGKGSAGRREAVNGGQKKGFVHAIRGKTRERRLPRRARGKARSAPFRARHPSGRHWRAETRHGRAVKRQSAPCGASPRQGRDKCPPQVSLRPPCRRSAAADFRRADMSLMVVDLKDLSDSRQESGGSRA